MITVVGVGIAKGDLTANGKKAIKNADRVFSRVKLWIKSENLGEKFSSVSSYGELDSLIAGEVIEASKNGQNVVYLALGDGYTDTAVIEIAKNSEVEIVAGVSEYRGKNPALDTRVISAGAVADDTIFDTTVPLIVYGIDDKFVASNIKLALACYYGDETQVVFSNKSQTVKIPLYELDRQSRYDGGALFIDGADFLQKNKYCYRDLMEVMKRLTAPDGCPWDRAQTHESIRVNLIEEAYEVVDAIDNGDTDNLIEELGDYLLQVVFHCDMATRDGEFTLCEVIDALVQKLVSRHTHIFGENKATDAESALSFWEKAKAKEKSYTTLTEQIERLPNAFSPLMRAGKISKKAVKAGADIDASKLTEKIENLVNGGINENNIGLLITYGAMLSSLLGVDSEVESNASVRKISETIEKAESENKLNEVSDKI